MFNRKEVSIKGINQREALGLRVKLTDAPSIQVSNATPLQSTALLS